MKQELKITLPLYKILYSTAFMLLIVMIRPIQSLDEIIAAIESSNALLAGVFMTDNYYKEFMEERIAVFYRYPLKKKFCSIMQRTCISWCYLLLLSAIFFWGFMLWYQPSNFAGIPIVKFYLETMSVCGASMFFFGVFGFTVTNFFQNIGAGIGITFLVWLFLISSHAEKLPEIMQLFKIYGTAGQMRVLVPYYPSRILYIFVGIILLAFHWLILQKKPGNKINFVIKMKKGWEKYGNKN